MTPPDIHQRIQLDHNPRRVRVLYQNHVIADSQDVITLQENGMPAVQYFPRGDVSMEYMSKTDKGSHCPYKGDASYYTLEMDGHFAENAVWTYETPFPAMSAIANYVAFYPNHVEVYEVDDAAVNPRHRDNDIDQIVQHTDTGAGHSQREPWPANVDTPGLDGGTR